jgi:hydroxymethylpyrimidine pyrophosphatase-like HAD family hydrolase
MNNEYLIEIMLHKTLEHRQMNIDELYKCDKTQRIILSCDPKHLDTIKRDIIQSYQNVSIYTWKFRNDIIDISLKHTCKWRALQILCEKNELSFEKIISFGDASSDKNMIINSDIGVAMANASEDIKKIANYVTKQDNNANGVYNFINDMIMNKENI